MPGLSNRGCRLSGGLCRPAAGSGWHWAAAESHRPCCRRTWCWPRLQTPVGKPHHRRRSHTVLAELRLQQFYFVHMVLLYMFQSLYSVIIMKLSLSDAFCLTHFHLFRLSYSLTLIFPLFFFPEYETCKHLNLFLQLTIQLWIINYLWVMNVCIKLNQVPSRTRDCTREWV